MSCLDLLRHLCRDKHILDKFTHTHIHTCMYKFPSLANTKNQVANKYIYTHAYVRVVAIQQRLKNNTEEKAGKNSWANAHKQFIVKFCTAIISIYNIMFCSISKI